MKPESIKLCIYGGGRNKVSVCVCVLGPEVRRAARKFQQFGPRISLLPKNKMNKILADFWPDPPLGLFGLKMYPWAFKNFLKQVQTES